MFRLVVAHAALTPYVFHRVNAFPDLLAEPAQRLLPVLRLWPQVNGTVVHPHEQGLPRGDMQLLKYFTWQSNSVSLTDLQSHFISPSQRDIPNHRLRVATRLDWREVARRSRWH